MAVLDPAAGPGDETHRLVPQVCELDEGVGRVVAFLVAAGIEILARADDIILKFAKGLEGASGPAGELLVCLAEHVLRRTLERPSVTVVEGAEEFKRRHVGEGVHESRPVARDDVKVAASGLNKREKIAAIDAFPIREDGVEVFL